MSMLMLTYVPCTMNDAVVIAAAKADRMALIRAANDEDSYSEAQESHWSEFMPLCECATCFTMYADEEYRY